jgi:coenzyme F420-reducing hydrogenase gamma subunit
MVYPNPEYISTLNSSMPISSYVHVDFELRGCPVNKSQLLEVVSALLFGRKPSVPTYSVCLECKMQGTACLMVSKSQICLGPVTQAGCGAICPTYHRGCYGCFGPSDSPNTSALTASMKEQGWTRRDVVLAFRGFAAYAEAFRKESELHENERH